MTFLSQRRSWLFTLLAVLLLLMTGNLASAQDPTGRVVGTVMDQQGNGIPGSQVTALNVATKVSKTAVTNNDGYYQIFDLPIGNYTITMEHENFRKLAFESQNLQINQTLHIDGQMQIGTATETIEVTDQASAVETINPTLGASVTGREIVDMPLNGRNTLSLALLQPGVSEANDGDIGSSGQGYNIAGGRSDSVTFLLDGGLNNESLGNGVVFNPNPDTIEEFRILENNYTAEYGRNGGGIITEVVKSGTNQWHGSAFDFLRNGDFNANSFFNKNDPNNLLPRDTLRRNQYGGTFGGPITIPHVIHGQDRFFFFVGYQGQRQSETQSSPGNIVPTTAELGGDFSHGGTPGNCPNADAGVAAFLQANPFFQSNAADAACAIIDPSKINSVAQKYIGFGLIPSTSNSSGVLNVQAPATNNDNQLSLKFDFNLTQKDRLSVTLGGNRNPVLQPFNVQTGSTLLGYAFTTNTNSYFSNFAYTRTFTPNVLNEFRVTVQRLNLLQFQPAQNIPTHAAVGQTGITPDLETGAAGLFFADEGPFFGNDLEGPSRLIGNTFAYSDVLTWTRGHHTWKFGGGFTAYQFNTAFNFIGAGIFTFAGVGGIGSGNDFADFLFGLPNNFQQGPNARTNARTKLSSGFAQDEWRLNKNLVLTLGVRYEYSTPKLDTHGDTFNVIPGAPQSTVFVNAPSGLVFPGDKGAPRGVNFPDKNNWAPRFGFAWDPKGDSKTSIRGGFGVFYDILKAEDNFQDNGQPPFFSAGFVNFSPLTANPTAELPFFADPFGSTGAVNPFPSKPPDHNINFFDAGLTPFGSTSIFLDDPHLRTPYIYQYNLSLQREIAPNTTFQIGYVGSSSHGLTSLVDINPFIPGQTDRVLNLLPGNSSCPVEDGGDSFNCSYSQLLEFKNVVRASYNGMVVSLTKQMSDSHYIGKTYFTVGYTYAHSIDNASGFRNNSSQVPTFNNELYRGSSDFDVRHRITISGGWDLPFDHLIAGAPKRLTQGWSIYPIFTYRTGFPLTVFGSVDTSGGFTNPGVTGAGDVVPHANLTGERLTTFNPRNVQTLSGDFGPSTGNYYFNPGAFTTQQVGSSDDPCPTNVPSPTCFPSTDQVIANPSLLTYGTAARGFFNGPGRTNLDMTLAKVTSITERLKFEIRVDAFNLFNHAEFADPITNIASPLFGQIVATGSNNSTNTDGTSIARQRVLQLGARVSF